MIEFEIKKTLANIPDPHQKIAWLQSIGERINREINLIVAKQEPWVEVIVDEPVQEEVQPEENQSEDPSISRFHIDRTMGC